MEIVNIAVYKFVGIPEPAAWQPELKERCDALQLKGTILLATEGINLFLAGSRDAIDDFLKYLQSDDLFAGRFAQLDVKESFSADQPFRKMVVRIAAEIITMRHPMIQPESCRAPYIDAQTLKRWLDEGRDDEGRELLLLDTRNDFEVEMGTFENALDLHIEKFSDFPDAVSKAMKESENSLRDKTIVSFCTGGIRCEKAALYLQEKGHPKVLQLDGGILRYFEDVGGAHWQGECFVFDERVSLDPALKASGKTLADRREKKGKN